MKKFVILIIILVCIVSCSTSGWSLKEQSIIKKIPPNYRNYNSGIIRDPSKHDIEEAISFGQQNKDNSAIQYAYITKKSFGSITVYVDTYTPLRLISMLSKNCAREYTKINDSEINYLSELDVVKISVTPQYTNSYTFDTYSYEEEFILLRNGIRVPTVNKIEAMNRTNPFDLIKFPEINDIMKETMQNAMQYTSIYTASYNREQKFAYCKQLKQMGYSKEEIVNFTGFPADSVSIYIGEEKSNKINTIYLTEKDNVYSIDELNKPGFYEIIFRTPGSNNLLSSGDLEKRVSIDFNKFK